MHNLFHARKYIFSESFYIYRKEKFLFAEEGCVLYSQIASGNRNSCAQYRTVKPVRGRAFHFATEGNALWSIRDRWRSGLGHCSATRNPAGLLRTWIRCTWWKRVATKWHPYPRRRESRKWWTIIKRWTSIIIIIVITRVAAVVNAAAAAGRISPRRWRTRCADYCGVPRVIETHLRWIPRRWPLLSPTVTLSSRRLRVYPGTTMMCLPLRRMPTLNATPERA